MFTPHHVWLGLCHKSCVRCQVSGVRCHIKHVLFFLSGWGIWWRICYQEDWLRSYDNVNLRVSNGWIFPPFSLLPHLCLVSRTTAVALPWVARQTVLWFIYLMRYGLLKFLLSALICKWFEIETCFWKAYFTTRTSHISLAL